MKEKYYEIHYGCGCGENEDYIKAMSEESAIEIAYEAAIEEYESFEGLHGIRGVEDIAEEDYDIDYGEIPETLFDQIYADYLDERESQLDYWVVEISHHDYLVGIGEINEDDEDGSDDENLCNMRSVS